MKFRFLVNERGNSGTNAWGNARGFLAAKVNRWYNGFLSISSLSLSSGIAW
jgi:hypothetical protein